MENLQDEVIEITANSTIAMEVYHGIGFVDANDRAQYFVSLDPDPGNYVIKIFKIRNEGFLIHLNNGIDVELRNPTNNIYQIDFDTKKKTPTPKEYKVVLWHENRKISKQEAKEVFENPEKNNSTKDKDLAEPNSKGTGIIKT